MPLYGKIVVIKRSGQDGSPFPLMADSCLFGRSQDCDIRIQLPNVSKEHCILHVDETRVFLTSMSAPEMTLLNGKPVAGTFPVNHKDVITVVDRSFRFEYPPDSTHRLTSPPSNKVCNISPLRKSPSIHNTSKSPTSRSPRGKSLNSNKKSPTRSQKTPMKLSSKGKESPKHSQSNSSFGRKSGVKRQMSPYETLSPLAKKKRVSFGPPLSPEQFDKNLPPLTPIRRGGLPPRRTSAPDYFGSPILTQVPGVKKDKHSMILAKQIIPEEKSVHTSPRSPKSKITKPGLPPKFPKKTLRKDGSKSLSPKSHTEMPNSSYSSSMSLGTKTKQRSKSSSPCVLGSKIRRPRQSSIGASSGSTKKSLSKSLIKQKSSPGRLVDSEMASSLFEENAPHIGLQQSAKISRKPIVNKNSDYTKNKKSPSPSPKHTVSGAVLSENSNILHLHGSVVSEVGKDHVSPSPAKSSSKVSPEPSGKPLKGKFVLNEVTEKLTSKKSPLYSSTPNNADNKQAGKKNLQSPVLSSPVLRKISSVQKFSTMKENINIDDKSSPKKTTHQKGGIENKLSSSKKSSDTSLKMSNRNPSPSSKKQKSRLSSRSSNVTSAKDDSEKQHSPSSSKNSPDSISGKNKTPLKRKSSSSPTSTASSKKLRISKVEESSVPKILSPVSDSMKSVALLTIHGSQLRTQITDTKKLGSTPKSVKVTKSSSKKAPRSMKRPLWSEVLKKGLMRKGASKGSVSRSLLPKVKIKRNAQKVTSVKQNIKKSFSKPLTVSSTGHVNSPATIVIGRRKKSLSKPSSGRKITPFKVVTKIKSQKANKSFANESGASLGNLSIANSTPGRSRKSTTSSSSLDLSSVKTPDISKSLFVSTLSTPKTIKKNARSSLVTSYVMKTRFSSPAKSSTTPKNKRMSTVGNISVNSSEKKSESNKSNELDLRKLAEEPKSSAVDFDNIEGVKKLLTSPGMLQRDFGNVSGIKRLMRERKSHSGDYTNVEGIKKLFMSPQQSPLADYCNVEGVKQLMRSRSSPKSSYLQLEGIKRLLKTPASPKPGYVDMKGVKRLLQSPKSPKLDYSAVKGLKNLFKTPTDTPIDSNLSGLQEIFASPNLRSRLEQRSLSDEHIHSDVIEDETFESLKRLVTDEVKSHSAKKTPVSQKKQVSSSKKKTEALVTTSSSKQKRKNTVEQLKETSSDLSVQELVHTPKKSSRSRMQVKELSSSISTSTPLRTPELAQRRKRTKHSSEMKETPVRDSIAVLPSPELSPLPSPHSRKTVKPRQLRSTPSTVNKSPTVSHSRKSSATKQERSTISRKGSSSDNIAQADSSSVTHPSPNLHLKETQHTKGLRHGKKIGSPVIENKNAKSSQQNSLMSDSHTLSDDSTPRKKTLSRTKLQTSKHVAEISKVSSQPELETQHQENVKPEKKKAVKRPQTKMDDVNSLSPRVTRSRKGKNISQPAILLQENEDMKKRKKSKSHKTEVLLPDQLEASSPEKHRKDEIDSKRRKKDKSELSNSAEILLPEPPKLKVSTTLPRSERARRGESAVQQSSELSESVSNFNKKTKKQDPSVIKGRSKRNVVRTVKSSVNGIGNLPVDTKTDLDNASAVSQKSVSSEIGSRTLRERKAQVVASDSDKNVSEEPLQNSKRRTRSTINSPAQPLKNVQKRTRATVNNESKPDKLTDSTPDNVARQKTESDEHAVEIKHRTRRQHNKHVTFQSPPNMETVASTHSKKSSSSQKKSLSKKDGKTKLQMAHGLDTSDLVSTQDLPPKRKKKGMSDENEKISEIISDSVDVVRPTLRPKKSNVKLQAEKDSSPQKASRRSRRQKVEASPSASPKKGSSSALTKSRTQTSGRRAKRKT